jgi:hypothetical protein
MSHLHPDRALALLALPIDDAERAAAHAHAATCADCAALLHEHEAMLHLLDASFATPPISPALAARVHTRVFPRRWPRALLFCTFLASLVLVLWAPHSSNGLEAVVGSHCTLFECTLALLSLGLGVGLSRVGGVRIEPVGFALLAGGSGLLGQWLLRDFCPVNGAVLHAIVFHFLAVLTLSLLGGALGRKIVVQRA